MTVEKWAEDFKGYINELELFRDDYNGIMEFIDEGANILKEQEAVKPSWSRGKPFCGACGLQIRGGKFCSECGKPIAWGSR